ncbi:MAG: tetratricopeptide repeat protein [Candidatus Edwardsbacteria bacterium]|nr:tetratricopeptide repeat protein [Candidatus Edwardsbacteria bacterium]
MNADSGQTGEVTALRERFARAVGNAEKTDLGLQLADLLSGQGACEEAIEILSQCRPLATDERDVALILQKLGSIHLRLSQYERAYELLGDALERLRAHPDSLELFQVYYDIAWMFFRQGYLDNARSYVDGARVVLDGLPGKNASGTEQQEAELLHITALIEAAAGNHGLAAASLTREVALHEKNGDQHRQAAVFNKLAGIALVTGDVIKAIAYQDLTHEISTRCNDNFRLALSHKNYGDIYYILGDYDRALENYQRALEIGRSIRNRLGEAFTQAGIGNVQCCRGDLRSAGYHLERALCVARELDNRDREACLLADLAALNCRLNNPGEALRLLDQAEQIDASRGQPISPRHRLLSAMALFQLREPPSAAQARQVVEILLSGPILIDDEEMVTIPELEIESNFLLARIDERDGRADEARQSVRQAVGLVEHFIEPLTDGMKRTFIAKQPIADIYAFQQKLGAG